MNQRIYFLILFSCLQIIIFPVQSQESAPTLHDYREGRADWVLEIFDVGLPVGESDTVFLGDGRYRSYLHASDRYGGVIDQCGEPVEFPGCLTTWTSEDGGESFSMDYPVCTIPCATCPCDDVRDHITAQQYPRVAVAGDGTWYMVYEWHAQVMIRTSLDGLVWSDWEYLVTPGGTWSSSYAPCSAVETIGAHPNIRGQADDCLLGGPPGIYIEGDMLYVFVMAGSSPSHMRCYKGSRHGDTGNLQLCDTDPLFTGATGYGDSELMEDDARDYWDFRYISSADILKVDDIYYMAYEGIRGPSELEFGRDNQFGLGFAWSQELDSEWQTFESNPVIMGLVDNPGIGHADFVIIDEVTYLYSATSFTTRGRYRLEWIRNP